jgi:hypothetical protein
MKEGKHTTNEIHQTRTGKIGLKHPKYHCDWVRIYDFPETPVSLLIGSIE